VKKFLAYLSVALLLSLATGCSETMGNSRTSDNIAPNRVAERGIVDETNEESVGIDMGEENIYQNFETLERRHDITLQEIYDLRHATCYSEIYAKLGEPHETAPFSSVAVYTYFLESGDEVLIAFFHERSTTGVVGMLAMLSENEGMGDMRNLFGSVYDSDGNFVADVTELWDSSGNYLGDPSDINVHGDFIR
jgi:hypothetical protein